jgi:hypothetical protein
MNQKYKKSLDIIWKADLIIAAIILYNLHNLGDNLIHTEALLQAGFFVLLAAITYTQKCRLDMKEE